VCPVVSLSATRNLQVCPVASRRLSVCAADMDA
jgi:hypothetical protein